MLTDRYCPRQRFGQGVGEGGRAGRKQGARRDRAEHTCTQAFSFCPPFSAFLWGNPASSNYAGPRKYNLKGSAPPSCGTEQGENKNGFQSK